MTEKTPESVPNEWADTPAVNPRYKGATPRDVARALLQKPACHTPEKVSVETPPSS